LNFALKKMFFLTALLSIALGIFCPEARAAEEDQGANPASIAVMAFQSLGTPDGQTGVAVCPLCDVPVSVGPVTRGAEEIVQEIFIQKLKSVQKVEIIPVEKTASVYKRIASESFKEPLRRTLQKVGRELKADYIAAGYVYRFSERVGYEFSSERPASVAYEIHLLDSQSGNIIWRGFFDKTQKSLMEDVLQISSFVKGGGKWLTARQLAEQGMDEIFKTIPNF